MASPIPYFSIYLYLSFCVHTYTRINVKTTRQASRVIILCDEWDNTENWGIEQYNDHAQTCQYVRSLGCSIHLLSPSQFLHYHSCCFHRFRQFVYLSVFLFILASPPFSPPRALLLFLSVSRKQYRWKRASAFSTARKSIRNERHGCWILQTRFTFGRCFDRNDGDTVLTTAETSFARTTFLFARGRNRVRCLWSISREFRVFGEFGKSRNIRVR